MSTVAPAFKILKDDDSELPFLTTATQLGGDPIKTAFGVAVMTGSENAASGAERSYVTEGLVEVACATGTTASVGDDAYYNTSTSLVVTSQPSAGYYIGKFANAKTSGQLTATIILNKTPAVRYIKSTYASGTWTVNTGLTTVEGYIVMVANSSGVQGQQPTVTESSGTITIASTSAKYTVTAADVANIIAWGRV